MIRCFSILILIVAFISCSPNKPDSDKTTDSNTINNNIIGTWKLVYGEIREKDSITIKDVTTSDFIKIINKTHFAFFNQDKNSSANFYGGAGSYTLNGSEYIEVLDFIKTKELRGHSFPFTIEIKGDSLIQYGLEEIKEANLKRYIIEKYIRTEDLN